MDILEDTQMIQDREANISLAIQASESERQRQIAGIRESEAMALKEQMHRRRMSDFQWEQERNRAVQEHQDAINQSMTESKHARRKSQVLAASASERERLRRMSVLAQESAESLEEETRFHSQSRLRAIALAEGEKLRRMQENAHFMQTIYEEEKEERVRNQQLARSLAESEQRRLQYEQAQSDLEQTQALAQDRARNIELVTQQVEAERQRRMSEYDFSGNNLAKLKDENKLPSFPFLTPEMIRTGPSMNNNFLSSPSTQKLQNEHKPRIATPTFVSPSAFSDNSVSPLRTPLLPSSLNSSPAHAHLISPTGSSSPSSFGSGIVTFGANTSNASMHEQPLDPHNISSKLNFSPALSGSQSANHSPSRHQKLQMQLWNQPSVDHGHQEVRHPRHLRKRSNSEHSLFNLSRTNSSSSSSSSSSTNTASMLRGTSPGRSSSPSGRRSASRERGSGGKMRRSPSFRSAPSTPTNLGGAARYNPYGRAINSNFNSHNSSPFHSAQVGESPFSPLQLPQASMNPVAAINIGLNGSSITSMTGQDDNWNIPDLSIQISNPQLLTKAAKDAPQMPDVPLKDENLTEEQLAAKRKAIKSYREKQKRFEVNQLFAVLKERLQLRTKRIEKLKVLTQVIATIHRLRQDVEQLKQRRDSLLMTQNAQVPQSHQQQQAFPAQSLQQQTHSQVQYMIKQEHVPSQQQHQFQQLPQLHQVQQIRQIQQQSQQPQQFILHQPSQNFQNSPIQVGSGFLNDPPSDTTNVVPYPPQPIQVPSFSVDPPVPMIQAQFNSMQISPSTSIAADSVSPISPPPTFQTFSPHSPSSPRLGIWDKQSPQSHIVMANEQQHHAHINLQAPPIVGHLNTHLSQDSDQFINIDIMSTDIDAEMMDM